MFFFFVTEIFSKSIYVAQREKIKLDVKNKNISIEGQLEV